MKDNNYWDQVLAITWLGITDGDSSHRIYKYWVTKNEDVLTAEDKQLIEDYING